MTKCKILLLQVSLDLNPNYYLEILNLIVRYIVNFYSVRLSKNGLILDVDFIHNCI